MNGQHDFGELGAHAQQGGDPHPEHSAGAADGDGAGHACDVARADGGGQSGADSLEGGQSAVRGLFLSEHAADGGADGVAEFAHLDKAGTDAQIQADTDNAGHGGNAPDEIVQDLVDVID